MPKRKRLRPVELVRIVFRLPHAAPGPVIDLDRRVHHDGRGRVAVVERRRIDERLERGARLAQRLRRAIELALVEREAADHREHAAGPADPSRRSRRRFPESGAADTCRRPCRPARHRSRRRRRAPGSTFEGVLQRSGRLAAFAHFTPSIGMLPIRRSFATAAARLARRAAARCAPTDRSPRARPRAATARCRRAPSRRRA